MSATVADHVLERLPANGVRRIYGSPRAAVRRQLPPTVMQPKEALVPEPSINDAVAPQGART